MANSPVSVLLDCGHLYQDIYTSIHHERKWYYRVKVRETWGRLRIARGEDKSVATYCKDEGGRRRNWQPRVILTLHLRRCKISGLSCPGLAGCL